jgi:hypothetical protein
VDKNLLLRHRMPLLFTRQARGRGLGSLYGPRNLDDSLLVILLVCAGEVFRLLLGAREVYQGHFGGSEVHRLHLHTIVHKATIEA